MNIIICIALLQAPVAADLPIQQVPIGERRIPMVTSSNTQPHPLFVIEQLLRSGDVVRASDLLLAVTRQLDGRLMAPPGGWLAPRRWGRLGAPEEILARWLHQLRQAPDCDLSLLALPTPTPPAFQPLPDAHRALDHAIERNELPRAWQMMQTLLARGDPILDSSAARAVVRALPTIVAPSPLVHPERPRTQRLRLALRIPLDPNGEVAPPQQNAHDVGSHTHRRLPQYVPSFPLVDEGAARQAIVVTGTRLHSIALDAEARSLWTYPFHASTDAVKPSLVHLPVWPLAVDGMLVVPGRTNATATPKPSLRGGRWPVCWLRWRALVHSALPQPPRAPQPTTGGLQRVFDDAALRGTIVAPPVVHGEQVFLLVATGWTECSLELVCASKLDGQVSWRRPLGSQQHHWHSSRDLRTLLPVAQLLLFGGDVIVSTGRGWLARVSAADGRYRGVLFYESWGYAGLPFKPLLSVGNTELRTLPQPEVRPPSPIWVSGTRLFLLPDDSQHVLAIDLARWQVAWAHGPVSRFSTLFPATDDTLVLVDGQSKVGSNLVTTRFLDATTGRVVHENPWQLPAPASAEAPLFAGPPLLVGRTLVAPTPSGLASVTLEALRSDAPTITSLTEWPVGSTGGAITPLPNGRWLTITPGTSPQDPPAIELYVEEKRE